MTLHSLEATTALEVDHRVRSDSKGSLLLCLWLHRKHDSGKPAFRGSELASCVRPLFFLGHLSSPDAYDLVFLLARE